MMMRKAAAIALLSLLWAGSAPLASATAFSFGTIEADDAINSLSLAADTVIGGTTVEYDAGLNQLEIEASLSTISFFDGTEITGITPGTVLFTSTVKVDGPITIPGVPFPPFAAATFRNGLAADFSIVDLGTGLTLIEADYDADALLVTLSESISVVRGEVTGNFDVIGGDADFVAAFGSAGSFNQLLAFGTGSLCTLGILTCPFPTDLNDFSANPTTTIQRTTVVPEPTVAWLALASLAGVGLLTRARRR